MSEFINRKQFIAATQSLHCEPCDHRIDCLNCDVGHMIRKIKNFPSADVAPVIHGHYVNIENAKNTIKCSNCGHIRELKHFSEIIKRPKLCEMCGAVMDESEEKTMKANVKKPDLKPCPFCGGTVRLRCIHIAMVECMICRAIISFGGREDPKQTVKAYNLRAESEDNDNVDINVGRPEKT